MPPPPVPAGLPYEDVRGRDPRTKIVCTVGPACREVETLTAMVRAGADVFRVNGAHAAPADLADWVARVRRAGTEAKRLPAVLVDLPGTKIRVGALPGKARTLVAGDRVRIVDAPRATAPDEVPVATPLLSSVPVGAEVLLQDGRIRLAVLESRPRGLLAEVRDGGALTAGTGVHFRGVALPSTVPTERDQRLLEAAVAAGADLVSQSFVRSGEEMARLRELLRRAGAPETFTIAKIERLDAVLALDDILSNADGVMVARGDLGVDAMPERVPSIQHRILEAGTRRGRPVIVATEMLESMITRTRPTRAEATDVATAVLSGADAVMLSGETAVGEHPVLVVETMGRILAAAEQDPLAPYGGRERRAFAPEDADGHVVRAAVSLAQETGAAAVAVFTRTGASALRLSKERPQAPIYAFTPSEAVCRRLALAWGVRARCLAVPEDEDRVLRFVEAALRGRLKPGARAVLVMGGPEEPVGTTTMIKLITAPAEPRRGG